LLALPVSAILTYRFNNDYYKDEKVNKKKMDTWNELLWMKKDANE
jgi:hypothetical protein